MFFEDGAGLDCVLFTTHVQSIYFSIIAADNRTAQLPSQAGAEGWVLPLLLMTVGRGWICLFRQFGSGSPSFSFQLCQGRGNEAEQPSVNLLARVCRCLEAQQEAIHIYLMI